MAQDATEVHFGAARQWKEDGLYVLVCFAWPICIAVRCTKHRVHLLSSLLTDKGASIAQQLFKSR
jgi:hypothetical protein